jgi:hypothetical protein
MQQTRRWSGMAAEKKRRFEEERDRAGRAADLEALRAIRNYLIFKAKNRGFAHERLGMMTERPKTLAEIQEECRRFAAETSDQKVARILSRAADDLGRVLRCMMDQR